MEELTPEDPAAMGPYRLTGLLGEGGMGRVYLGESRSGRRLAVKVVRPQIAADPGFRERFRREVEAARTVGGFWTAPIVDADPDASAPWVASDYIDAPDLAELVRRDGPLSESGVRALAAGLAEALEAIHGAGLVHRDLKPSNILVTGDGPRVIDFGISKALEGATTLTDTGLVVGTPGFMSPEQASGGRVGPASDVFSLGSVLAFAATGEGPFGEGSVPALLYRVVHDVPRLDGVPAGVRGAVEICLEKRPERRPGAGELLDLLSGGVMRAARAAPVPEPRTTPVPAARTAHARPVDVRVRVQAKVPTGPGGVAVVAGIVGGGVGLSEGLLALAVLGVALLIGGAIAVLRRENSVANMVGVRDWGLTCRFWTHEWHLSWHQLERVTVELRDASASNLIWLVSLHVRDGSGVSVPAPFRREGRADAAAVALPFTDPRVARTELTALDAALRAYAPEVYERDARLARLLES